MEQCVLSHVQLFATPWTVDRQVPLSMEFSRQEYWSGLPCPPSGNLPDPGIEPISPVTPALQLDSLPLNHWGSPLYILYFFHGFCPTLKYLIHFPLFSLLLL